MIIWNGIIPAHGSVKISFCVAIDLNVSSNTTISNQGYVYYDSNGDGTNDASEPTDDPETPLPNDPTNIIVDYIPPWSWLVVTRDPDGYITRASTFHIYADDDSGIWKLYYVIDGIPFEANWWNTYVEFQINEINGYEPGPHTIEYWAVDGAGNEETPHHLETYILDVEGPSISISFVGPWEKAPGNTYQVDTTTHIALYADDMVDVSDIRYCIDDGGWIHYTHPFLLPYGEHDLYVVAYDALGNIRDAHYYIRVGVGAPITTIICDPQKPSGNNGWYRSIVSVSFTATDDVSGVASTYYKIDNDPWQIYTEPVLLGDGVHTVNYYSIDNAGFTEEVKTEIIKIDMHPPEISIERPKNWLYIADRAILPLPGNLSIIIGKITMIASASDTTSGVQNMLFYIDGHLRAEDNDTVQYILEEPMLGIHHITIVAHDVAGNEAVKEIKFFIAKRYHSFESIYITE